MLFSPLSEDVEVDADVPVSPLPTNADVLVRAYIKLKACSLLDFSEGLTCRNDEEAEHKHRKAYSSRLKKHIPPRANRPGAFEVHDIRSKVCVRTPPA